METSFGVGRGNEKINEENNVVYFTNLSYISLILPFITFVAASFLEDFFMKYWCIFLFFFTLLVSF